MLNPPSPEPGPYRPPSSFDFSYSEYQRTTTDTSTTWGPGTLSGRALLALGEATLRGINSLIIRRRLTTIRRRAPSLTKSMCDDLLELCRPAMYSTSLGEEATGLILTHLCVDSRYSALAVALCDWPPEEARLILLRLMRSLSQFWRPRMQVTEIYNLLAAIIQIHGHWKDLVKEAAHILRSMAQDRQLVFGHPIDMLCTGIPPTGFLGKGSPYFDMPFSEVQAKYSDLGRQNIWMNLQAAGLPLNTRLRDAISILKTSEKSTAEYHDARVDVVIFTSAAFDHELRTSAISFLLECCVKSTQWNVLYQTGSLDVDVQQLMVTAMRDQLNQDEIYEFVGGFPPSHVPVLFLSLSAMP
ncbi:hypothetical protein K438DRAFT_1795164 [Mycena galopus ATCC 62051]|nr:hypothetical protein K438DRAFT_1795164 [Mycena galopus ATCC 62051]